MKKIKLFAIGIASALIGFVSCSADQLSKMIEKPSVNFEKISFGSLDTDGITLNCNYSVKNPYPISLSLAKVMADVKCNGSDFTTLTANEGISITKNSTKSNTFNFKIPYDSLLNFAKNYGSNKSLPFTVSGNAQVSNSIISSLSIPFSKTIDVPVFKPSFSLSNPKIVLPTLSELTSSLINGGVSSIKAASLAKSLLSGEKVASDIFDGINLNVKLNFDLSVKNEGGAAWNYLLKSCSIKSSDSSLIDLDTIGNKSITSSSGTIPLTATLNTLKFGKFVAQIINKSGSNPTFALESGISFPEVASVSLPLSYSKDIPLSNFGLAK